jgi:hypothetical protein
MLALKYGLNGKLSRTVYFMAFHLVLGKTIFRSEKDFLHIHRLHVGGYIYIRQQLNILHAYFYPLLSMG